MLVLIAVLIGATLGGVIGALLAIPVAAAIQIVMRDVWQQHQDGGGEAPAQRVAWSNIGATRSSVRCSPSSVTRHALGGLRAELAGPPSRR
jgi:hypothetical protein